MNSSLILLMSTVMGKNAVELHRKDVKLTYVLNVHYGMKAEGQILFQICINIPWEIESDNAKSICHDRVMRMGE